MALLKRTNGLFPSTPNWFDDFLPKDLWSWGQEGGLSTSLPAVNVKESDQAYELDVAVPGLKKEDFKVEVNDGVLTISSEKGHKDEEKDEQGNFTRREFSYQSFKRSFTLPQDADESDDIHAKYEDGILHVTVPKRETKKEDHSRLIEIS